MSESSSKSSQPLASKQEKDGAEKRGRGRPREAASGEALGLRLAGGSWLSRFLALAYLIFPALP